MMEAIYTFNGKDITMNVCLQIEPLWISFRNSSIYLLKTRCWSSTVHKRTKRCGRRKVRFGRNRRNLLPICFLLSGKEENSKRRSKIKNQRGKVHLSSLISGLRFIGVLSKYAGQIAGHLRDPCCPDAIRQRQNSPAGKPSADSPALLPARPNTAV